MEAYGRLVAVWSKYKVVIWYRNGEVYFELYPIIFAFICLISYFSSFGKSVNVEILDEFRFYF
jgi:hypothetical protein